MIPKDWSHVYDQFFETVDLARSEGIEGDTLAQVKEALRVAMLQQVWSKLQEDYPELREWRFDISTRVTSALGYCYQRSKRVTVAYWVVSTSINHSIDTLLHEAAHALTDIRAQSHGDNWRYNAYRLGCKELRASCSDKSYWKRFAPAARKAR